MKKFFVLLSLLIAGCQQNVTPLNKEGEIRFLEYGEPVPQEREEAINTVAEKWGIEFYSVSGCEVTRHLIDSVEDHNKEAAQMAETRFGTGWRKLFDKEVEEELELRKKAAGPQEQENTAPTALNDGPQEQNIAIIQFNELSVLIDQLLLYDPENKLDNIQKEKVEVYAELGETIEGQLITVSTDQLVGVKVEQRYETSVTIMSEGPHCDLIDWKHFNSEWKPLKKNGKGQFIGNKYTEKDRKKFPQIKMDDLRQKASAACGEEWAKMIKNNNSPIQYPSTVDVSRYFLRITGKRKDTGKTITKIIVIETPMGC